MDLIDLKRRIGELTSFINYQKNEVEEVRNTLKATTYDVEPVGGTKKHDFSDIVIKIVNMEKDIEKAQQEYDRLIPLLKELEECYKKYNDRDKLIFLEHYCKGYNTIKIGIRYGITDRQVRNILKKTKKRIEKENYVIKNNTNEKN